jgi:hypothetical protein
MIEFKCANEKCGKYFGHMKEHRAEHQWSICPWCGYPMDIGTKRKEPDPNGMPEKMKKIIKELQKKEKDKIRLQEARNNVSVPSSSGGKKPTAASAKPKGSGRGKAAQTGKAGRTGKGTGLPSVGKVPRKAQKAAAA